MVRIIRHGWTRFPTKTLRAFLSKDLAYPLLRWRMLRSGYLKFPAQLEEKVLEEVRGFLSHSSIVDSQSDQQISGLNKHNGVVDKT